MGDKRKRPDLLDFLIVFLWFSRDHHNRVYLRAEELSMALIPMANAKKWLPVKFQKILSPIRIGFDHEGPFSPEISTVVEKLKKSTLFKPIDGAFYHLYVPGDSMDLFDREEAIWLRPFGEEYRRLLKMK